MAKRNKTTKPAKGTETGEVPSAGTEVIEDRLVAFADMLGTTIGTIHGKAGGWVDTKKLNNQLAHVRDGAARLLEQLASLRPKKEPAPAASPRRARSGGGVDAPGKKHRKPTPSDPRARKTATQAAMVRNARTPVMASRHRGRG